MYKVIQKERKAFQKFFTPYFIEKKYSPIPWSWAKAASTLEQKHAWGRPKRGMRSNVDV